MKITLAIVNITSFVGQCSDAQHVYGHLILCTKPEVNLDNVEEWNVKYLGENIELFRELTWEQAVEMDVIDHAHTYKHHWEMGKKDTERFDTFMEVIESGLKIYNEMKLLCPFISLYEGEYYDVPTDPTVGRSMIINNQQPNVTENI